MKAENWIKENGYSLDHDIEVFNEKVLSANQVALEKRPELMRLLKAIELDQIKVVVVYVRDRLARNFYEYMEIVAIFLRYNVRVIFLEDNHAPFSYNFLTEGVYGIQIQQDGSNIASRIRAVQKLYPNKKFGFINDKVNRKYKINEKYHYNILTFFEQVSKANTFEQICNLLKVFKKENKRKSVEDCWKLLRTEFYAGQVSRNGKYFRLDYIESPIVSLDLFEKVQEVLNTFQKDFIKAIKVSEEEAFYHPTCAGCNKKMVLKKGKLGESAYYFCENHKNNTVTVRELNIELKSILTRIIKNISTDKLKRLGLYSINKALQKLNEEKYQLSETLKKRRRNLFLRNKNPQEFIDFRKEHLLQQKLVERQIKELKDNQAILKDIKSVVENKMLDRLETEDIYVFVAFFIENVFVYEKSIDYFVYFTEFMEGEI